MPQTPAEFLKAIKGKAVLVKLNSGVDYRGAQGRGHHKRGARARRVVQGRGAPPTLSPRMSTAVASALGSVITHVLQRTYLAGC